MRRAIVVLLLCFASLYGGPLAHTTFTANNAPSTAIDTTGASILFIAVTTATSAVNPPVDNKGNTWNLVTTVTNTRNNTVLSLYSAYGPGLVVGPGHTVSDSGSGASFSYAFFAFSGFTGPSDRSNAAWGNFTANLQPGSITPSANGELIVSVFATANHGPATGVDSGITMFDNTSAGGSGISPGYLTQTSAAAVNPIWSATSAGFNAALIASFPSASPPLAGIPPAVY